MKSKNITFYIDSLDKQIRQSCLKMLLVEREKHLILLLQSGRNFHLPKPLTSLILPKAKKKKKHQKHEKNLKAITKTADEQTQILSGAINFKKTMCSLDS